MYVTEQIQKGAQVFFELLKSKVLSANEMVSQEYYNNVEVREIVRDFAREAGLRVFETRENIHMVSSHTGSIFANSYTQMKEKYSGLERKRYFYLANIIICVYISEVDRDNYVRIRWEEEGISYSKLEDIVTKTLESWKKRQEAGEDFTAEWGIALDSIYDLWINEFSLYKGNRVTGQVYVVNTKGTRYSFIHEALKPLSDQKLVYDNTGELRIIPRNELYERLDNIYHRQERYTSIMELIKNESDDSR